MYSFAEPKRIDLETVSPAGLTNLIVNYGKHGRKSDQAAVVRVKWRRGLAKKKDYSVLDWNPASVEEILSPFVALSRRLPASKRVYYSNAGGGKFKPKGHEDAQWIDAYTAIKVGNVNAAFACHVREPGDKPIFILNFASNGIVEVFSRDELDAGLMKWNSIVESTSCQRN